MVSMRIALFTLVSSAAALKAPSNTYTSGADDLKKMMESVRVQTEDDLDNPAPHQKAASLAAQKETQQSTAQAELEMKKQVSAGEDELLHRTDVIAKKIVEEKHPTEAPKPAQKTLSLKQGASRYFSINGMKDMSRLLDDELSNDEQEKLVTQNKFAEERRAHAKGAKEVKLPPTAAGKSIDDANFDDNDEYKQNWKRVEALKAKMPPM